MKISKVSHFGPELCYTISVARMRRAQEKLLEWEKL